MTKVGALRLRKPCKDCEEKFRPATKFVVYCNDCRDKRMRDGYKRRKENQLRLMKGSKVDKGSKLTKDYN